MGRKGTYLIPFKTQESVSSEDWPFPFLLCTVQPQTFAKFSVRAGPSIDHCSGVFLVLKQSLFQTQLTSLVRSLVSFCQTQNSQRVLNGQLQNKLNEQTTPRGEERPFSVVTPKLTPKDNLFLAFYTGSCTVLEFLFCCFRCGYSYYLDYCCYYLGYFDDYCCYQQ